MRSVLAFHEENLFGIELAQSFLFAYAALCFQTVCFGRSRRFCLDTKLLGLKGIAQKLHEAIEGNFFVLILTA